MVYFELFHEPVGEELLVFDHFQQWKSYPYLEVLLSKQHHLQ
jgi:hypothetical protein